MKIFKHLAILAVMVLLGATLTSCGGYSDGKAKDMIVKNSDGKLEEADYTTMIEWVDKYYQSYNDEWQNVIEQNKDEQDYKFAKKEMDADYNSDYIFIDDIENIVVNGCADEKKVGKENKESWEKVRTKINERKKALQEKANKILK